VATDATPAEPPSLLVGFSNGLGPLNHRNQAMWLLDAVTAKQKRAVLEVISK
jgi:hypothetical protein